MEVAGPAIKHRSCPECRGGSVGFTKWQLRAVHHLLQRNARLHKLKGDRKASRRVLSAPVTGRA
jgi:hypothetical protein